MRWWRLLYILLLITSSANAGVVSRNLHDAELKINIGEMQAAKTLLESLLTAPNLADEEKAAINNKLAWFYEKYVGNYATAERYSRKALGCSLPATHRAVIESKARISRLKRNAIKYREEHRIINTMRIDASGRRDAAQKIAELKSLIRDHPEFPDLPVAYHYIGKHYLYLGKYYKSYSVFSKVIETRPGIIFLLPTAALMAQAKSKWIYFLADRGAKLVVVISLLIMAIALYLSKFWQWLDLKKIILLPIGIGAWALILMGSAWFFNFFIPDQQHLYLETPAFIQSHPFSPGSEILYTLFGYGALGITGSFLMTLATGNLRRPRIRLLTNSLVSMLFTISVLAVFYLNHCYAGGIFEKRTNSAFPVLAGHTYLREKDYEPLILTNPRKYPALDLSGSSDEKFKGWVRKQYAIISRQSKE